MWIRLSGAPLIIFLIIAAICIVAAICTDAWKLLTGGKKTRPAGRGENSESDRP